MAAPRQARYDYRVTTPSKSKTDYRRLTSAAAKALSARGYTVSAASAPDPLKPLPVWQQKLLDAQKEN